MKTYAYHPIDKKTGKRLTLRLTGEHLIQMNLKPRENGYRGLAKDLKTSSWFRVWAYPCRHHDCMCDAVATRVGPDEANRLDPHE